MSEMVKVVVDAMGGDNAPVEPVKAAVEAVKEKQNIQVILTGQEDVIQAELQKYPDYPKGKMASRTDDPGTFFVGRSFTET